MSDLASIIDYMDEAESHIRQAEDLLETLEQASSSEARRLRAAMYVAAMKRLKRLIDAHHIVDESEFAPAIVVAQVHPAHAWPWSRWKTPSTSGIFRRLAG